jgi:hypothetical protein
VLPPYTLPSPRSLGAPLIEPAISLRELDGRSYEGRENAGWGLTARELGPAREAGRELANEGWGDAPRGTAFGAGEAFRADE